MVLSRWFSNKVVLVVAATVLSGCGGDDPLDKLAKDKKLSPEATLALKSCQKVSKTVKVSAKFGKDTLMFIRIPPELCACQANEMARVFTEEGLPEHNKIVLAFADEPKKAELDPLMLKEGVVPTAARSRLEQSFKSCMPKTKAELKKRVQEKARKLSEKNKKS